MAPKWKRLGFSSYRQYLNAVYKYAGYKSFADYTRQRTRAEVEGETPPPSAGGRVHKRSDKKGQLKEINIGKGRYQRIKRIYRFAAPVYDYANMAGELLATWGAAAFDSCYIENKSADKASYFIKGKGAFQVDEFDEPIWQSIVFPITCAEKAPLIVRRLLIDRLRSLGDKEFEKLLGIIGATETGTPFFFKVSGIDIRFVSKERKKLPGHPSADDWEIIKPARKQKKKRISK